MSFWFVAVSSMVLYAAVRLIFFTFSSCFCENIFYRKKNMDIAPDTVLDLSETENSSNAQLADDEYESGDETEVVDLYRMCIGPEFLDVADNELYDPSSSESGQTLFSESGSETELSETEISDIINETEMYEGGKNIFVENEEQPNK